MSKGDLTTCVVSEAYGFFVHNRAAQVPKVRQSDR